MMMLSRNVGLDTNFYIIVQRKVSVLLFLLSLSVIIAADINARNLDDFTDEEIPIPLYGSLHTLEKLSFWARKEEDMYNALLNRRESIQKEIELILGYVTDLDTSVARIRKAMKIWKLLDSQDYQTTKENVDESLETGRHRNVSNIWPLLTDFYISNTAILHTHFYADYQPNLLSYGTTVDTKFGGLLKPSHCIILGFIALSRGHYVLAIEWFEYVLKQHLEIHVVTDFEFPLETGLMNYFYIVAVQEHNQLYTSSLDNPTVMLNFFKEPITSWKQHGRLKGRDIVTKQLSRVYGNDSNPFYNMLTLCEEGVKFQPQSIASRMHCYLEKHAHPYFTLIPLKTEQISEFPLITQYYDVLGNDTLQMINRKRGALSLKPVRNIEDVDDLSIILYARSWVGTTPTDNLLQEKIRDKTELVTGLTVGPGSYEDSRRIIEYTYGRHFSVHRDVMYERGDRRNTQALVGDPAATLLFYVEAPVVGGANTFCSVGVSSHPVRGSAVLWTNMFRNGTIRNDVYHGGCPVIHGHKIVLTQWIQYHENFHGFNCKLNHLQ